MSASTPAPPTSSSHASSSRRVPLDKRKRTETSCDKCKSRKQKCRKEPGQEACRYCIVHNIECLTTQPRKKRLYGSVEGLGTRLALLEALVKGLLPEADVSSTEALRQLATSHGILLGVEKRVTSPLLVSSSIEKIVEIDAHIGCAMSGLQADARSMITAD